MDFTTYFDKFRYFGVDIGFKEIIDEVVISVRTEEYNALSILALLPLRALFGFSRFAYIASVIVVYAVPSLLLLTYLVKKQFPESTFLKIFLTVFVVTPPLFWGPILRGYLDVLVFVTGTALMVLAWRVLNKAEGYKTFVLIGVLLFAGPLLRRWEVMWSLAFVASLAVTLIFKQIYLKDNKKIFLNNLSKLLFSVAICLFLVFLVRPRFFGDINYNFVTGLNAFYGKTFLLNKITYYLQVVGGVYLALFFYGVLRGLSNPKLHLLSMFLIGSLLLSCSLFLAVQDFNDHHSYLYLPVLMYFLALGFHGILHSKSGKYGLIAGSVFVVLFVYGYSTIFSVNSTLPKYGYILPKMSYPPLIRDDFDSIDGIVSDLSKLVTQEDGSVYILSSSLTMNETTIASRAQDLKQLKLVSKIMRTSDVDSRDGFPSDFFTAKYIVLTDPPGYHMDPWDQRSIGLIQQFITDDHPSYQKLSGCYYLDGGYCAMIYKKIDDLKIDTVLLENRFYYSW